ncbi:unnamed protein product [Timema podura]|uniref:Uncharacterized protein n=1 Tax=Timema podura TaxID=61482 RepID=A0ABN7P3U0_TIMPD|nr:unnamed protein product [Timema podura]
MDFSPVGVAKSAGEYKRSLSASTIRVKTYILLGEDCIFKKRVDLQIMQCDILLTSVELFPLDVVVSTWSSLKASTPSGRRQVRAMAEKGCHHEPPLGGQSLKHTMISVLEEHVNIKLREK